MTPFAPNSRAVIIQARAGSSRLPGKVLMEFCGASLLEQQIRKIQRCAVAAEIIVATSTDRTDDSIEAHCREIDVRCTRGSLTNVASRIYDVVNEIQPRYFARYCSDRPFFDGSLLEQAFEIAEESDCDVITNVFPPSFPKGLTTEVVRGETFIKTFPQIAEAYDQEHVVTYFYRHPERFTIENFACPLGNLSELNLCVDTQADFDRLTKVARTAGQDWATTDWRRIVSIAYNRS